jgi:hypothetical protein
MIDGTMTVSDHGGKSILEEAVNTMKINRQIAAAAKGDCGFSSRPLTA